MMRKTLKEPYKFCMVPYCSNTTVSAPQKLYICVPHEPNIRNKWLEATNRNCKDITASEVVYCCEDHFDLANDAENWNDLHITNKIKLKKDVVPHKFYCQNNRNIKRKKPNEDCVHIEEGITNQEGNIEERINVYKLDKNELRNLEANITSESNKNENSEKQEIKLLEKQKKKKIKLFYIQSIPCTSETTNTQPDKTFFISNHLHKEDRYNLLNRIKSNIKLLKENSSFYVGIPEKYIFIINLLSEELNVPEQDILLCLKKIRRNINMIPLANDFGINQTAAINCLLNIIPALARYFQRFIFWPESDKILKNLPRPFRKNYKNVESVISCLEITRPAPEDNQTRFECWSLDQNKYIYRYLISSTPDGLINFVSGGFGGSKSDNYLMEKSGYLDVVPFGKAIMINEGYLHVGNLLHRNKSQIFWPPKLAEFNDIYNTKYVGQTKKSISIKMCTGQVLKRFQEFLIVHSNACIHPELIPLVDDIIVIIAGLMNLQNSSYDNKSMYLRK